MVPLGMDRVIGEASGFRISLGAIITVGLSLGTALLTSGITYGVLITRNEFTRAQVEEVRTKQAEEEKQLSRIEGDTRSSKEGLAAFREQYEKDFNLWIREPKH